MLHTDRENPLPSRQDLQQILNDTINLEARKKLVELLGSYDRIVAEDIFAERSLPTTYTYKADGIAINYQLINSLQKETKLIENTHYIHANQGWPVEEPFDTVIPLGDLDLSQQQLTVLKWPEHQQNYVDPPGAIMEKGTLLVPKNTVITGPVMGLLAMGGIQAVPVYARPRILFIPTGDELVDWQETALSPGENIESNSVMVAGFAQKHRCKLEVMPIIPDDKAALIDALHYAKDLADLVIISAGTSKGKKDFTKQILAAEGSILIHETGFDPGRYLTLATLDDTPILSLPGSPKGVELTLGFCLPTIVSKYYQQPTPGIKTVEVIADFQYQGNPKLDSCLEIALQTADDNLCHGQLLLGKNLTKGNNLNSQRGLYYLPRGENITLGQKITVEIL